MQVKALLFYTLLPASIMYTSITVREPYQLLFVDLAVYAALEIYIHRSAVHWPILVIAVAGAGSLHGGLLAWGILFIAGTFLLVSAHEKKGIQWEKILLTVPIAVVVLWVGFSHFGDASYNLDNGLGSAVSKYQQGGISADARAQYKTDAAPSSTSGMLLNLPVSVFLYFFEPFPWRVSAIQDVIALMENILRGWLIWKVWKLLRSSPVTKLRTTLFLFLSYLMMETIWSLGTINWGTSARHHIPSWGLLLLAAFGASDGRVRENALATLHKFRIGYLVPVRAISDDVRYFPHI